MVLLHAQGHLSRCNRVPISSHLTVIHRNHPPTTTTFLSLRNFPPCESSWEAELAPTVLANTVSSYVPEPTLQVGWQHLTKSDAPAPASNAQEQGSWEGGEAASAVGSGTMRSGPQKTAAAACRALCHLGTQVRHLTVQLGQQGSQSLSQIPPTSGSSLYKPLSF